MKTEKSLVIDNSAVMSIILEEASKPLIIMATVGYELFAPSLLPVEVSNALTSLYKQNRIKQEVILPAFESYKSLPITKKAINYKNLLNIAIKQKIYAYDASYLELSLRFGMPLLTLDGGMKQAAKTLKIQLLEV
jgi:predicted nucleic acid-binding protein